jgi:hypothetical protein
MEQLTSAHYRALLEHSFDKIKELEEPAPETRLQYLSMYVFNFTTYDGEMDVLFARKMVEVCKVITERNQDIYLPNPNNYQWYLLMCNMPFLQHRLEWGISIRYAWWELDKKNDRIDGDGFYAGDEQVLEIQLDDTDEWESFIKAVIEFAAVEMM